MPSRPLFKICLSVLLGLGLSLSLLFLLSPTVSHAQSTLYVDPSGGNDANNCTLGFPCASIQRAIEMANSGDTINLSADTHTIQATVAGETQLGYITKSLTIQGAGPSTILDGQNSGRAFYISQTTASPVTVNVNGLVIQNGSGTVGGAIYAAGVSLSLQNVSVSNSAATADGGGVALLNVPSASLTTVSLDSNQAQRGGGLFAENSTVNFNGDSLSNNTATSGGGLFISGGAATLTGVTIASNLNATDGGGLFAENGAQVSASNSPLSTHSVTGLGGGAFLTGTASLTLSNASHVSNNQAQQGGGVFIFGGNLTASDSDVSTNSATNGNGGGVWADGSRVTSNGGDFSSNTATGDGGAIWLRNSDNSAVSNGTLNLNEGQHGAGIFISGGELSLSSLPLTGNLNATDGGGLYAENGAQVSASNSPISTHSVTGLGGGAYLTGTASLTLSNASHVSSNQAQQGGGIFIFGGNLTASDSNINSNSATNGDGGGVWADGSRVTSNGSDFSSNTATGDGGAIWLRNSDNSAVSNGTLNLNEGQHGAGIFISGGELSLSNLPLTGNLNATDGGGLFAENGAQVSASNSPISTHSVTGLGGGAFLTGTASLTLTNASHVSSNQAQQGGGIFIFGGNLTASDSNINSNSATNGDGGGVWAEGSRVTSNGGDFSSNTATGDGGAVWLRNPSASSLSNGTMTLNEGQHGAGIFISGGDLSLTGLTVTGNLNATDGGGLYAENGAQVSASNSPISTHSVTGLGGGAFLTGTASLTLTNASHVSSNQAQQGGGVFVFDGRLNASDSDLSSNSATNGDGGGVFAFNASLHASASNLHDNTASVYGGGLFLDGVSATLNDSQLYNNQAERGGGGYLEAESVNAVQGGAWYNNTANDLGSGLYLSRTTTIFTASQIYDNSQVAAGTGLYAFDSQTRLHGVAISQNNSLNGGGIYAISGTMTLTGSSQVLNNRANQNGGGIFWQNTGGEIQASTLNDNYANLGGGALYVSGGVAVTVTGSTFDANSSNVGGGGAVRFDGAGVMTLTVRESTISNNTSRRDGAGFYVQGAAMADTTFNLSDNVFSGNRINYAETVVVVGEITETQIITSTDPPTIIEPRIVTETQVSAYSGAAVYLVEATGQLERNQFVENRASATGGALSTFTTTLTVVNNLFAQNEIVAGEPIIRSGDVTITLDVYKGSAIYAATANHTYLFNTFADNDDFNGATDLESGTAIFVDGPGSKLVMYNNIIADHDIGLSAEEGTVTEGSANIWWNSSVRDWTADAFGDDFAVHYFADPLFVDAAGGDYRLQKDSPGVNTGVNAVLPLVVSQDLDGLSRPSGFQPDIGAYEHRYTQGLYLKQTPSDDFTSDGRTLTHTISLMNGSASDLSNVTLTDALPSQQTLVSISSAGGSQTCNANPCNLGTLSANSLATVTVVVAVSGTPPPESILPMTNTVTVSFDGLNPADSDVENSFAVYLQEMYDPARVLIPPPWPNRVRDPIHTGVCRIQVNGLDYNSLNAGLAAISDEEDVMRLSGYCGGTIYIKDKMFTLQGGWSTDFTTLDPDAYPTTIDAGGRGSVLVIDGDVKPTIENLNLINGQAASGGGIYIKDAAAKLINLSVSNSQANVKGGGIYIDQKSVPEIRDSRFENNSARQAGGGAYLFDSGSSIQNSIFSNNSATDGGGLYLKKSAASLISVTVTGHNVSGFGGGIHLQKSPAQIQQSTIQHNSAKAGGGVYANESAATLNFNDISYNSASRSPKFILIFFVEPGGGGGIYGQQSDLRIQNNLITYNSGSDGAGIHLWDGTPAIQIDNNVIAHNNGHGVYMRLSPAVFKVYIVWPPLVLPPLSLEAIFPVPEPAPIQMRNNTFANNSGSGLNIYGQTSVELTNSIFINDDLSAKTEVFPHFSLIIYLSLPPIPIPLPLPVTFYYPVVNTNFTMWNGSPQYNVSGAFSELNNSNDFANQDLRFKEDGYHIKRVSPAYDAGRNTDLQKDIDNQDRLQSILTDIGADEYPDIGVRYVAEGGGGTFPCIDHLSPCPDLATAILAARKDDIVKVGRGNYSLSQELVVDKSITIQGGYIPSGPDNPSAPDNDYDEWEIPHYPGQSTRTIIDAGGNSRHFTVTGEIEPTIAGLELTGGQADKGGAIHVISASVTISDVQAYGNTATEGGAIYLFQSTGLITNSQLENNTATRGGGLYLYGGEPQVANSRLANNTADLGGGGYVFTTTAASLISNTFGSNTASVSGGGLYLTRTTTTHSGNHFQANQAPNGGGLFATEISGAQMTLDRYTSNTASASGGGFFLNASEVNILSATLSLNSASDGGGGFIELSDDAILEGSQVLTNTASNDGGGIFLSGTGSLLKGNTVINNTAVHGGGVHLDKSPATLENNTISQNTASADGGGVHLVSFSFATLLKNTIATNTATLDGGGVYLKLSNSTLDGNTISGNSVQDGDGGGVFSQLSNSSLITNTISDNRSANSGGGLYLDQSQVAMSQNRIWRNQAATHGGGLYLVKAGQASVSKNQILTNTATNGDGGGLYLQQSPLTKVDFNTFAANTALAGRGGGAYLVKSGSPFEQNWLTNNQADSGGGAYFDESNATINSARVLANQANTGGGFAFVRSNATVINTVLKDNQASTNGSGVYAAASSPLFWFTTLNSNNQGDGVGVYLTGIGNENGSASFVNTIMVSHTTGLLATVGNQASFDSTLWFGNATDFSPTSLVTHTNDYYDAPFFAADGYHLTADSPAVDKGLPIPQVSTDLDQQPRLFRSGPDLGADEFYDPCAVVLERTSGVTITYAKVQLALDDAVAGDTVKVAGTCQGSETREGHQQLAYLSQNITLSGGFTFTNWITPDFAANRTLLDANGTGRVFFVEVGASPVIQNFEAINGKSGGQMGGPSNSDAGGGLYAFNASPVISNVTFGVNDGGTYGGGVYLQQSRGEIRGSTFQGNTATFGGGIFLNQSQAYLLNNTLQNNSGIDGGGLFLNLSPARLEGNQVLTNAAGSAGGGIFFNRSSAIMTDTMMMGNTANNGAAVYLDQSQATLHGGEIRQNAAESNGGGFYLEESAGQIQFITVMSNTANNGAGAYLLDSPATFDGNSFSRNQAGISGGGLYLDQSDAQLTNNIVVDNEAETTGSGVYIFGATANLYHNNFIRNRGEANNGLFVTGDGNNISSLDMKNNIIIMHDIGLNVTAGHSANLEATIWGSNGLWGEDSIGNGTDVVAQGTVNTGTINLYVWPGFVNFDAGDYHIFSGSPAVNAGVDAGLTSDIDEHPRPTGAGFDIGADEYYRAELNLSKSATPNPAQAGSDITYTLRVESIGNVDLNLIVTDTLPSDIVSGQADGQALTPGQVLTWAISLSEIDPLWETSIVVQTPITDSLTLTNVLEASSLQGPTGIFTHVLVVGELTCNPTIQSVSSGEWDDPSVWNLERVPRSTDIAQVMNGHTVTAPAEGLTLRGLCVESGPGTLQSAAGQPLTVNASEFILNGGQISGQPGEDGPGSTCGGVGSAVNLEAPYIQNEEGATAQGGAGGAGDECGGDGGALNVLGGDINNQGTMTAGAGGAVNGNGPGEGGGDGGDATIAAVPGTLVNGGTLAGGAGGAGSDDPGVADAQPGGDGGDLSVVADPEAMLSGGTLAGGAGGDGAGDGGDGSLDGADGDVTVSADQVTASGPDTAISGGDVAILGGENASLDLSNLDEGAIQASGDILIATDAGGVVDLSGNEGPPPVLQADADGDGTGGEVAVAAAQVQLEAGQDLSDIGGAGATASGPQSTYALTLLGGGGLTTAPLNPLAVPLTLLNSGPTENSYALSLSQSRAWPINLSTAAMSLAGTTPGELSLTVTPPLTTTPGMVNVITVTAESQSPAGQQAMAVILVTVGPPSCNPTIQSVQSGAWDAPSTWNLGSVPRSTDEVQILTDHTVTGPEAISIRTLCNDGTLLGPTYLPFSVETSAAIYNNGLIKSSDGRDAIGEEPPLPGSPLTVQALVIYNPGVIQAGRGGNGNPAATGGDVALLGDMIMNSGDIAAGNGGRNNTGTEGPGGDGGTAVILAGVSEDVAGELLNLGEIAGGDGGAGQPATSGEAGGDGGDAIAVADDTLKVNNGSVLGGQGAPQPDGGTDGIVSLSAQELLLGGAETELAGENVILLSGDDGHIELSNLGQPAVVAVEDVILTAGPGGQLDLNGNQAEIMQADADGDSAGEVILNGDDVALNSGVTAADVAGAGVTQGGAAQGFSLVLLGPSIAVGDEGETLTLNYTLINSGPYTDSVVIGQNNSAGWLTSALDTPVSPPGASLRAMALNVTVPAQPAVSQNVVTVNATSQNAAEVFDAVATQVYVGQIPTGTAIVYLPLVLK